MENDGKWPVYTLPNMIIIDSYYVQLSKPIWYMLRGAGLFTKIWAIVGVNELVFFSSTTEHMGPPASSWSFWVSALACFQVQGDLDLAGDGIVCRNDPEMTPKSTANTAHKRTTYRQSPRNHGLVDVHIFGTTVHGVMMYLHNIPEN